MVSTVAPRLVNAALNLLGKRSEQKVVEMSALDDNNSKGNSSKDNEGGVAENVTRALTPAAARLCIDIHGSHVIQRILRSNLVKRIVEKSLDLMQDAYGNYVVQYVLDV